MGPGLESESKPNIAELLDKPTEELTDPEREQIAESIVEAIASAANSRKTLLEMAKVLEMQREVIGELEEIKALQQKRHELEASEIARLEHDNAVYKKLVENQEQIIKNQEQIISNLEQTIAALEEKGENSESNSIGLPEESGELN